MNFTVHFRKFKFKRWKEKTFRLNTNSEKFKNEREKEQIYCNKYNQNEQICAFLITNNSENNAKDNILNEKKIVNANNDNTINTINNKIQVSFVLFFLQKNSCHIVVYSFK